MFLNRIPLRTSVPFIRYGTPRPLLHFTISTPCHMYKLQTIQKPHVPLCSKRYLQTSGMSSNLSNPPAFQRRQPFLFQKYNFMLSMHHYKTAVGKQLRAENECPCMDSPPLGRKLIVRFINAIDQSQHKITCAATRSATADMDI